MSSQVFIGVLRATVIVPGARSLKDRRQVVRSLRDRVRSRFEVTFNELEGGGHPGRQDVVLTTGGNDGARVRQIMDSIREYMEFDPRGYVSGIDVDVFPWHPDAVPWTDDDEEPHDG